MSGFTPVALTRFRDLLRARGCGLGALAEQVGTSRPYLSQVLWQHFYSPETWARIRACVTAEEWATLLDVENCATWNRQREDEGLDAECWLVRVSCSWCAQPQGFKACVRVEPGEVTHSICPTCVAAHFPELEAIKPRASIAA